MNTTILGATVNDCRAQGRIAVAGVSRNDSHYRAIAVA